MKLSIVIAYFNEPLEEIRAAVESIKSTIDIDEYEIIIADDHSKVPLVYGDERVTVVRQDAQLGVGRGLALGVRHAKSENVFLQGNDIRYLKNGWASKMIAAVEDNPKSVICTLCVGMNTVQPGGMDLEARRTKVPRRNGSTILVYHDHISNPKKPENFQSIVECKWLPIDTTPGLVEIPCVLGAAYIVKKKWFEYMNPWCLHKSWGTLEPMLGISSWLMGGSNLCHHDVETGHIFQTSRPRNSHHIMYNKFVAAHLFFPEDLAAKLISFLEKDPHVEMGRGVFTTLKTLIFAQRDVIKEKTVFSIVEWAHKFNIDLRGYGDTI